MSGRRGFFCSNRGVLGFLSKACMSHPERAGTDTYPFGNHGGQESLRTMQPVECPAGRQGVRGMRPLGTRSRRYIQVQKRCTNMRSELIQEFLEYLRDVKRFSENTIRSYALDLEHFCEFLMARSSGEAVDTGQMAYFRAAATAVSTETQTTATRLLQEADTPA